MSRDERPGATYRSWFLWEERLKNFRTIRRGILEVVREIEQGTFGTAYRDSLLETVVGSIASQRQIFKGADHAFLWKPKLRIPDIYESRENQLAFAEFLDTCACCNGEKQVLTAIRTISQRLSHDPVEFGEPLYRLPALRLQIRHAVVGHPGERVTRIGQPFQDNRQVLAGRVQDGRME